MGNLYLVRHGQASLGAADYDQLSPLGVRQSQQLGQYFKQKNLQFEAVLTGTLRRHAQTYDGIMAGMANAAGPAASSAKVLPWPGLNEYDSEAIMAAVPRTEPLPHPSTPEGYRQHFRLLRDGLKLWMQGESNPAGMPSWVDFRHGVTSALDHVRANYQGHVLVVSSGGPISTAISHVLEAPVATTIDLNMRIRNSAVSELLFTRSRHSLLTFNTLPHLDHPDYADWVTHA
jgi:broad specificity phosphatase PhoE